MCWSSLPVLTWLGLHSLLHPPPPPPNSFLFLLCANCLLLLAHAFADLNPSWLAMVCFLNPLFFFLFLLEFHVVCWFCWPVCLVWLFGLVVRQAFQTSQRAFKSCLAAPQRVSSLIGLTPMDKLPKTLASRNTTRCGNPAKSFVCCTLCCVVRMHFGTHSHTHTHAHSNGQPACLHPFGAVGAREQHAGCGQAH